MKPMTVEWVEKAEGDLRTAQREFAVTHAPNYDAVAFHAQQCAEKYLKARLVEAELSFPRTHDLNALLNAVVKIEPAWNYLANDLILLTELGLEVRYPGVSAEADDARAALLAAEKVRATIRARLEL